MRTLAILGHGLGALILLVILSQDVQIFAEILRRWTGKGAGPYQPPADTRLAADDFVVTADGNRIHFRRWASQAPPHPKIRVAILSHGNAGAMHGYKTIPEWLARIGITSYVYDYRGYGLSTGFPSERGVYRDADAIWKEAVRGDQATPANTLVFGHSLGGGPATYLAEKHNAAVLVVAATFTSIPERAALHPQFGMLAPFVWSRFPNTERIARLKDTCVIVLHAAHDNGMPRWMADTLVKSYRGTSKVLFSESATANHDNIVGEVPVLTEPLLPQCP
jgi:alpha-beta hydrolase superfamily lysophospholipase